MLIPLVGLLLLVVAGYFLIRTKPNLFLFDLMRYVFGEAGDNPTQSDEQTDGEKSCKDHSLLTGK